MNETLKAIAEHYSCRDFTGAPIDPEQVRQIAEAALAAPSGMNRQPWHVIMVTDKAFIDEMDEEGMRILAAMEDKSTYERMMSRGGKLFYNAPCMVMVASPSEGASPMDCGILSQNVALAAHALGLGSVIVGMAGMPLSGPNGDAYKQRLKFPAGYGFGIGILVGAAATVSAPHALDMTKLSYVG